MTGCVHSTKPQSGRGTLCIRMPAATYHLKVEYGGVERMSVIHCDILFIYRFFTHIAYLTGWYLVQLFVDTFGWNHMKLLGIIRKESGRCRHEFEWTENSEIHNITISLYIQSLFGNWPLKSVLGQAKSHMVFGLNLEPMMEETTALKIQAHPVPMSLRMLQWMHGRMSQRYNIFNYLCTGIKIAVIQPEPRQYWNNKSQNPHHINILRLGHIFPKKYSVWILLELIIFFKLWIAILAIWEG